LKSNAKVDLLNINNTIKKIVVEQYSSALADFLASERGLC